jgi:hypothetical protein
MLVADALLGTVLESLSKTRGQEVLLIVSSDHWFRLDSQTEPQPVPFIAWKPGESTAATISKPISTVHTASLVLDFIDGKVDSHADIVAWWQDKPVYPTFTKAYK